MATLSAKVVGENVTKYRKAAGLSQAALAERIGVSVPFLSRVERGQKLMKLTTLLAIAQALDVSCDALLRKDGPESYLENITVLLKGKSAEYLSGIECIVRACMEGFPPPPTDDAPEDKDGPASPIGGAADEPRSS